MLGLVKDMPIKGGSSFIPKKFEGYKWGTVIPLPYKDTLECSAVLYNGEFHILGGYYRDNPESKMHYKLNKDRRGWTQVSTLPTFLSDGSAVVYNNEIHIIAYGTIGKTSYSHYKWDGSNWIPISTSTHAYQGGVTIVHNGEIHLFGGSNREKTHMKYDGTTWSFVSTLPNSFVSGAALSYHNEIHIMGGGTNKHYKWTGTQWEYLSDIPNLGNPNAIEYHGNMYLVSASSSMNKAYMWTGNQWNPAFPYTYGIWGTATVMDDKILSTYGGTLLGDLYEYGYFNELTFKADKNMIIMCKNSYIRNINELLAGGYLKETDNGYIVLKDTPEFSIVREPHNTNIGPLSIIKDKQLLYADKVIKKENGIEKAVFNLPKGYILDGNKVTSDGEISIPNTKDNYLIQY